MGSQSSWTRYLQLPRPVYVLCLGIFLNRAGTLVVPFLAIYLQNELHVGEGFAASTIGAYGLGSLMAALIGGYLADKIGRRAVMLIALFGGACVLVAFSRVQAPSAILPAALAFALLSEMFRPAASAMIADLVEPDQRNHAFGLSYFAINLGFSIAPIVGGILAVHSYQLLFWGDAGTAVLFGVIILWFIPETHPSRSRRSGPPSTATASASARPDVPLWVAVRRIADDRLFLSFTFASLLGASVYMQCISTLPLYMQRFEIDPATYGRIIAVNAIMIVVFQLPVTSLVSRFPRGVVVTVGAAVTGIGFGLTGYATTPWHFALTVVVWTAGEMMQAPLMIAIASDLAPAELRGRYMGVFSLSFSGGMMIGAPTAGWVLERWGGGALWGGCFAVCMVSAAVFALLRRHVDVGGRQE